MSRRGRDSTAFSLFAFQDIITSVTGIMILVTLILALELINRKENSPSRQTQQVVEQMRKAVQEAEDLQRSVAENEARIAELQDALERGAARIGDVAGFDMRAVRRQIEDNERINQQLAEDMKALEQEKEQIELAAQQTKDVQAQRADDPRTLQQFIQEIRKKQDDLEKLRQSKRVIFNPAEGDNKTPWLVEIDGNGLTAAKVGESARPQVFPSVNAFQAWAARRNRNKEYFVLLVKPEGIEDYAAARQLLKQLRFDMGFDLLTEEQVAIDPDTGAAAQ